jgi:hypothetical protein
MSDLMSYVLCLKYLMSYDLVSGLCHVAHGGGSGAPHHVVGHHACWSHCHQRAAQTRTPCYMTTELEFLNF